jgi:translation initiation factor 2 alpha subunit (eIF-2alpha)
MNVTIKRQKRTTEVSLTSVHDEQIDLADETYEPFNVLSQKIEALAEALNCSAEEAERFLLSQQ